MINWDLYKNFNKEEFDCKHTGLNRMRPETLELAQQIRDIHGPMVINSGYRDETHPLEARKPEPGEHFFGMAFDVKSWGVDGIRLISIAYGLGVRRFGIADSFIHIGIGNQLADFPEARWTY